MTSPRRGLTATHGTSYDDHWDTRAACKDADPELFHTPDGERGNSIDRHQRETAARAICATCPVLLQCRRYALDNREEYGIWGGLTEDDRKRFGRRRPAPRPAAKTPTPAQPTKRGPNAVQQARREAARVNALKRRQEGREPTCGTRAGYDHHRALGEPYCGPCRTHRRDARRQELQATRKTTTQRPLNPQDDRLVHEVRHLVSVGADIREAARALGKTVTALERALYRKDQHELVARLKRAA